MKRFRLKPTSYEQRAFLYEDVQQLISPGFLVKQLKVGDTSISLRSLFPSDLELIKYRTEGKPQEEWRSWIVAHSIFMVGDVLCLKDTAETSEAVYSFVKNLPSFFVKRLYYICLSLFKRIQEAIDTVNLYSLEDSSRISWRLMGNELKVSFPYVEKLGFNTVQNLWSVYNKLEDQNIQFRNQWEGFKLVARTNSPKAIETLSKRELQEEELKEENKQKRLDLFFYYKLGHISKEIYDNDSVYSVNKIKRVEDLQTEFENWVKGVKDDHDIVVSRYKEHIKQGILEKEKQREEYLQYLDDLEHRQEEELKRTLDFPKLRAYTPQQLQTMLREQKGRKVENEEYVKSRTSLGSHLLDNNKP